MARQRKSVLDTPTQERSYLNGAGDALPAFITERDLTHEQQRTIAEFHRQRTAMEVTGAKAKRAMTLIAELDEHSVQLFKETADAMEAAKEGNRERNHQAYIDEFCDRSKKALANHLSGARELGVRALAAEAQRSMYLKPEPPPKRSLRQVLLG